VVEYGVVVLKKKEYFEKKHLLLSDLNFSPQTFLTKTTTKNYHLLKSYIL